MRPSRQTLQRGGEMAAGPVVDDQSGPPVREKKARSGPIPPAGRRGTRIGWSGSWTRCGGAGSPGPRFGPGRSGPMKLHVVCQRDDDPDPVALCCYGLLRHDTDRVLVRFVEGRPVGNVTSQFLGWACDQFWAEGKTRLVVVWDEASWHAGGGVVEWIGDHNRRVQREGGVQIVLCPLPVKSPWLNNIETRWGPAKRAILEMDRILTAEEVVVRVWRTLRDDPVAFPQEHGG